MKCSQNYYLTKIKEDLSLKQRENIHYSLRAYARDMGIHPATLSQVLNGNRLLPVKNAIIVADKMNLGPKERSLFMESLLKSRMRLDKITINEADERFMLDESYHKVISEWEHYALLELFMLHNFESTIEEIIKRLGITQNRVNVVIDNLLNTGLLRMREDRSFENVHGHIRTTEDITNHALRDSHRETLEMGKKKLDEIEVELRDFSSTTVAVDLKKLPEAKAIIREFRKKMTALLRDGQKTEVFQLAIQFYPLTTINKD
jgi:uncharacterized protein (TIGR02147 family)